MKEEVPVPINLVAIDDDLPTIVCWKAILKQPGLNMEVASDAAAGLDLVLRRRPQIVLLDLMMPKLNGMEVLERILAAAPDTDVILLTGHYSIESAVEAIRKGAADYVTKPVSAKLLRECVGKFVEDARRRQLALLPDEEGLELQPFEGMIGNSPLLLQVFSRIRRVAPHFRTVLITGPTGSGKELVASALHRLGPAASRRFVTCNCSAVVQSLFESELFGHVKGAFTSATQDKMGLFEYANGGTLFLDEIGDMPLETQAKLLRVLENGEIQRVGSPAVRKVEVRVIAATNSDLREMVALKKFREDLFFRLSMVEVKLPSLLQRKEDLPRLERHFIEEFSRQYGKKIRGLTQRAQLLLARYSWPGNVRELKSVLASACMEAAGEMIDIFDLPEFLRMGTAAEASEATELLSLAEVEKRQVLHVLENVGGNKAHAAKILGINRSTLYRILGENNTNLPDNPEPFSCFSI